MSILDKFFGGGNQTAAQQVQQQTQPQQQAQQTDPSGLPNNTQTSPAVTATQQANPVNPLDALAKLWSANPQQQQTPSSFLGELKPETFTQLAQGMDYGSLMTPDQANAIQAGGEGAVNAIKQLLNSVGQASFATASMQGAKFVNDGLGNFNKTLDTKMAEMAKREQSRGILSSASDVLNHPGIKPVAEAVHQRIVAQWPNATAQEQAEMTKEILMGMAKELNPQTQQATSQQSTQQDVDWMKIMGLG